MFNKDQYKDKIQELADLKERVKLKQDPTAEGLRTFNTQIADIQSARERIAAMALEALWNRAEANQYLSEKKEDYQKKFEGKLTDEGVQKLKSKEIREATINTDLTQEVTDMQGAEKLSAYADDYHKSVQIIDKLYDNKNSNLLQQILVVRMMTNIDPALRDELKIQLKGTNK